jgi:CubicO group peptidase (beta-lactamase class C family)
VLAALARTKPKRAPGERFRYSNFGAGLLGLAVCGAEGIDDFETLVRERIAQPLGMTDTVIALDEDRRARLAAGTSRRGKPAGLWSLPGLAGAGALRSTAADLLTFARAQLGELPAAAPPELGAAIAATHEPRARGGRLAPGMRIGLGWMLMPIGREKLETVWHNGGTGGYRSYLGIAPARRTAAVALSSNVRSVDRIGARLLLDLGGGPAVSTR